MRYFLNISYHGKNYHGWQIQQNAHSVQSQFNDALKKLFGKPIDTIASGRTDTGVHAISQYVQIDLEFPFTDAHLFSLNRILPFDISIKSYHAVFEGAHARFDALSRLYIYKICRTKNPFVRDVSYYFSKTLNIEIMNAACQLLGKYNDFECFSKVHTSVDHFKCNIQYALWEEENEHCNFTIQANRFLRGMVRAIVGTMIEVGLERLTLNDFEKIIQGKDRKAAGRSVPPHGLFLKEIKYPEGIWKY